MADYDSDSSGAGDVETNVLLGYASKEPTSDDFSQLGGHPTWLDPNAAPSGALAKCKVCKGLMNLLLQINGDLPARFPGHERRLYLWACRRKTCRRKEGSIRALRMVRHPRAQATGATSSGAHEDAQPSLPVQTTPATNLGEALFGVKSRMESQANPFSSRALGNSPSNPFSTTAALAAKPSQKPADPDSLPETFAQKVRLSTPEPASSQQSPSEPWPEQSSFPDPSPSCHLDADKEYIDSEPVATPSGMRIDRDEEGGGSGSAADDKAAFESSMDKTFQHFADRLAQSPEQVLRYEFDGQPLLYSKKDKVGRMFVNAQERANSKINVVGSTTRIPRCDRCGAQRVFELQLTPHAIAELEAEEVSVDGMDWGTIILCVCTKDCQEAGKVSGEVGTVEEWVGVQWEELAGKT